MEASVTSVITAIARAGMSGLRAVTAGGVVHRLRLRGLTFDPT